MQRIVLRRAAVVGVLAAAVVFGAVAPRQQGRKSAGQVFVWQGTGVPVSVKNLQGVKAIAGHLALTDDGNVYTFGYMDSGGVRYWDVEKVNNLTGVVAIAQAGVSLALTGDGKVWAWGENGSGQLGDGSFTPSGVPVAVSNLAGVVAIASGGQHSLALTSDGRVWAWGSNTYGQLGNGGTADSNLPVAVSGLAGVVAISAGDSQSLALTNEGKVWTWGAYTYYVDLIGEQVRSIGSIPVLISNFGPVTAIAGGEDHSLALTSDGRVWAWGWNRAGGLGTGSSDEFNGVPAPVSNLNGVAAIACHHTNLALTGDGKVWAWEGQPDLPVVPVAVSGLGGVVAISTPGDLNVALQAQAEGWAWGYGPSGAVGDGTSTDKHVPVKVISSVAALAGGGQYSLALTSDGKVWEWGTQENYAYHNSPGSVPVAVSALSGVVSIAANQDHSLALTSDGKVWAWGANDSGQLGNGGNTNSNVPGLVSNLSGVVAVAAGGSHSLALTADGKVWAWGANGSGQLGSNSTSNSNLPVAVGNLSGVTAIAAGGGSSLALTSDGKVWAWGDNAYGQLGNGTSGYEGGNAYSNVPLVVNSLGGVVAIANGLGLGVNCLVLTADGKAWAWGYNNYGQLGGVDNSFVISRPVAVANLGGVVSVAAGGNHSLAVTSDGKAWAWGFNYNGQLGNDSTSDSRLPVSVSNLSGVIAIAVGSNHSLAIALPIGNVTINSSLDWSVFTTGGAGCDLATYAVGSRVSDVGKTLVRPLGNSCQVEFISPQSDGYPTRGLFTQWTDNNTSNPRTLVLTATGATYTAVFKTQHQLSASVNPPGAGTVTGGGYYDANAVAPITATSNPGYRFVSWTGNVASSASASTTVVMNAPLSVTANFERTGVPISDDFNGSTLKTALWTFVNPVGNGGYSLNGSELLLNVPGGSNHDPAYGGTNNSVRIVQSVADKDFTVEVKFDSIPSQKYQFEGILAEQDSANYLRFQFGSNGSALEVGASKILARTEISQLASTISLPNGTTSLRLRVQRTGNTWTVSWSPDGLVYKTAGSFVQALVIADIGPFAGNYAPTPSAAPAFTAKLDYCTSTSPTPAGSPTSDNFNGPTLNTTLWTFVNPVGNGSYSLNGSELLLNVPGGSNHDPAFGGVNNSVRVVQSTANKDFTVEVKYDSIPSQKYQFEGILAEQDPANYLRFQFGSAGGSVSVSASKILARAETSQFSNVIPVPSGTTSLWLRVQRTGNTWTVSWSSNGSSYNTAGSFTQALVIANIGPFAGNYAPTASAAPAFTAKVDYWHGAGPLSDSFNSPALDTALWTFVNPVGNGSYSLNGSELLLNVPGGSNHDPAFGGVNNSVRVVQAAADADFTIEAKFDSIPLLKYQFEGILVDQNADNYLRFQFGSAGGTVQVGASKILSRTETTQFSNVIPIPTGTTALWLRIRRAGSMWTVTWSSNGTTYNTAGSFTQALAVSDVGVFAGNYAPTASAAPAFTAKVDAFIASR